MLYRKLHGYKYELAEDFEIFIPLEIPKMICVDYIQLKPETREGGKGSLLNIKMGYAWDGASGPTIDDDTNRTPSLVHDALYQLMRLGVLDYRAYRSFADRIFVDLCKNRGMSTFRAEYYYNAVRLFAAVSAKPNNGIEPQLIIYSAP